MNRLKVLISAYACNPSSSARLHPGEDIKGWRFIHQVGRFHDVWVITHSYNKAGVDQALKQKANSRITFIFVDLPSWLRLLYKIDFGQRIYYYLWQIKAWLVARRYHRQIRFDVAHHLSFGNDWIPSFIGALLPVPFIWGPLGGGQRTPELLLAEYTLYGRFAEKMRDLAQFIGRNDYFRRRCLRKSAAILVCNKETREKIPDRYDAKLHWFPLNGVFPEDIVERDETRDPGECFRIVSAGRLHRLKGFALGIKAFADFTEKYPHSELTVIGKGPEYSRLSKAISERNLSAKVKIIDWMNRRDLLAKFRESDVFLFPSFRDGGGAVVVEAMAAGLPVICLNSGGPAFHVSPEWGMKIEPFGPAYVQRSMALGLERLYLDRSLCKRMGQNAQRRAKDFYLSDRLGERLNQIYLDLFK